HRYYNRVCRLRNPRMKTVPEKSTEVSDLCAFPFDAPAAAGTSALPPPPAVGGCGRDGPASPAPVGASGPAGPWCRSLRPGSSAGPPAGAAWGFWEGADALSLAG
ncbi:Phage major capsid protein, partial [Dysosmobacter welbionis]